jgi:diguanylate cyclase (GGDEF)-like protein/PAS domain S-box-containing protein
MDVAMPGMDGYETAKLIRMRKASEHTPIIFITARASDEAEVPLAYANGAVDFIFGKIVPNTLRAKVAFFVELFLKSHDLEHSLSEVTILSDQFRDSEAHTRAVLESIADGVVTLDDDGVIESFNRAATDLFGYSEDAAIGRPFSIIVPAKLHPEAVSPEQSNVRVLAEGTLGGRWTESLGRREDGSTFPIEVHMSDVQLGTRVIHIGCVRDLSERQTYTEALKYQTLHDPLTDLPNRLLFGDRVNHAIRVAVRTKEPLALLVMDLDEFKQVNDTIGHQHGDALLKLVALRLTACLREGDTVARLGGDEFGILPLGSTDLPGAATVAWKIEQALEAPFLIDGHVTDVRASIGITLIPEHGDNIDDLLRRADLAMYEAKRSGGGYAVFAAAQERSVARRLALLHDLRHCVANDELVLHYQPKIDLATLKTTGMEALIRWNHPSDGFLAPAEFMPEVEDSELMIPITMWVINEALRQLRIWRDQGHDLTMAVNVGACCLDHGAGLLEDVDEITSRWGIPPNRLTIELTENALLDTGVPELLARLKGMEQRLSIDDFGTGYSSLVYLQRLPVSEIKADRSFVTTMVSAADNAAIVRAIIDLAHNLSRKVVAEGVEDEATMELLIAFGCDSAQGYYFSRPLSADDLVGWLETSPFGSPRGRALAA